MLDSILQVAGKRWCTPEILYDFIRCLDEACLEVHKEHARALLCPYGRDRKIVWK